MINILFSPSPKLLDDAIDAILVNEASKRKYLALATRVNKLYRAILPDPEATKFGELSALFKVIADKIRSLSPEVDISEVTCVCKGIARGGKERHLREPYRGRTHYLRFAL